MGHTNQKYTLENTRAEALKYTTRKEFEINARPFYAAAHRNKWLDTVCKHMEQSLTGLKWTKEKVKEEALKYSNKAAFHKEVPAAYKQALANGYLEEICSHMNRPKVHNFKYTKELIMQEFNKYQSYTEFYKLSPAYDAALRLGLLDELKKIKNREKVTPHNKLWTLELCIEKLKTVKSRTEFQEMYSGAYAYLITNKLLQQAFDIVEMGYKSGSSKEQEEIYHWLLSLGLNSVYKYKLESGLEIDIYLPDYKIGIEYNGLYWHSDTYKRTDYHIEKIKKANSEGIQVINVFQDVWETKKDKIKQFILNKLKFNQQTIYARKCEIKEISIKEAKTFLNENHIQGAASHIVLAVGLIFNHKIISVMSFGSHPNKKIDSKVITLNRLAIYKNISIIGGASKMLKFAMNKLRTSYEKIISWSDNAWVFNNNVYTRLGFILEDESKPDYFYVKNNIKYSKKSKQKPYLKKLGGIGKTEYELALSLGYYRIWDCGKKRWAIEI